MTLVLGSQSPRRREILGFFKIPFVTASPPFDEEQVAFKGDPIAFAAEIAKGKADSLYEQFSSQPILTADTVVYCDGKVYGKPGNHSEVITMLQELSGRWQSVFTALTLRIGKEEHNYCEESRVLFNEHTPEQLEKYSKSIPCLDKAGAYAIQMAGGIIARRIEGCYYNVMGLPLAGLQTLLAKIKIDLWDHLG